MRAAKVEDGWLHFDVTGPEDAPALVLVNSLGTDLRLWDELLPGLERPWRVLRYDVRGHGLSSPAEGAWTIERHAADLVALMDAVGIEEAALFGVSVGGMIAQAVAAAAPGRVRALVLACTAARIGDAALWDARIARVRAEGLEAMADDVLERWFPETWRAANPGPLALHRAMLTHQPPEGYAATCAALRDGDLTAAAARIAAPTLVIAGSRDGATPPEVVRGLARLVPGARLVEIEGAGHLPMVDRPAETAAAAEAFLAETARA